MKFGADLYQMSVVGRDIYSGMGKHRRWLGVGPACREHTEI